MIEKKLEIGEDITSFLTEKIIKEKKDSRDFSSYLLIFPHKRPKFFIEKFISKKISAPFYPPVYFDIDALVQYLLDIDSFSKEIDLYFLIFSLFEKKLGFKKFLKEKPIFAFEWGKSFLNAFDKVQMELIELEDLKKIKLEEEDTFFEHFPELCELFLRELQKNDMITRGLSYNLAARKGKFEKLEKFERIFYVIPPGLTKSEREILKKIKKFKNLEIITEGFSLDENFNVIFDDFSKSKNFKNALNFFKIVPSSSDHAQLIHLRKLLKEIENEESVAIVLPKSRNLLPLLEIVLNFFPEKEFNVSLGYPLSFSQLYKTIEAIFDFHIKKIDGKINLNLFIKLLLNPFILTFFSDSIRSKGIIKKFESKMLGENIYFLEKDKIFLYFKDILAPEEFLESLNFIFKNFIDPLEKPKDLKDLAEKIYEILNLFSTNETLKKDPLFYDYLEEFYIFLLELINSKASFSFEQEDLFDLFLFLIQERRINFKGHPLKGWQILGFLETRTLSFKNVFFLNLNEGIVPAIDVYDPILPLTVKKILKIPGPEEEEKIFKHHFLHLLCSSQKCNLFYIENEEEKERSRFIEQIIWEKQKAEKLLEEPVEKIELKLNLKNLKKFIVEKDDLILEYLRENAFSYSSIDTYLSCPLKFYFGYVLNLEEEKKLTEDLDYLKIGETIHKILEELLKDFAGKEINEKSLKEIIDILKDKIEKVFNEKGFRQNLQNKFLKNLIYKRIYELLNDRKAFPLPFKILKLEEKINGIKFNEIKLNGRLDRIDVIYTGKKEKIRVVEYKSGKLKKFIKKGDLEIKSFEEFQNRIESFQVPVYIQLVKNYSETKDKETELLFYSLRNSDFFPKKEEDLKIMIEKGEELLKRFFEIIFDKSQPFEPKPSKIDFCNYCSFFYICKT